MFIYLIINISPIIIATTILDFLQLNHPACYATAHHFNAPFSLYCAGSNHYNHYNHSAIGLDRLSHYLKHQGSNLAAKLLSHSAYERFYSQTL